MLRKQVGLVAPCTALALLALPFTAAAGDFSFKLEPGVAVPLSAPQSDLYGVGAGQSVKALFGLTPYLDIGPAVTFMILSGTPASGDRPGTAWGLGGGLRLKRPHDADTFLGISPWMDADVLFVRTGALSRPAFDLGAGVSVPLGRSRTFWMGPFVRYLHILQGQRPGYDDTDAKILTVGLSFEAGSGIERAREPVVTEAVATTKEAGCPDRDEDATPDSVDRCPDVAGPADAFGCPNYKKLVVKPDKLELKEKLYFAWGQAKLEDESFPVLDEVVQALKDNPRFRVQIEGHSDSSGGEERNQTLSEQRAITVLDYLAAHGIAKERLISKGLSSSVPLDTNATVEGRENNRRVEFVVHFIIVNKDGSSN